MTEVPPPPPREPYESLGSYKGPSLGPPPSDPPASTSEGPPGTKESGNTSRRPRWLVPTIAAVVGLVVGAAGVSAVVGLTADDDSDDVGQACAIVAGFDENTFEGDADQAFDDPRDLYRASAAANLFFAANDGEFEGELGDIGQGLQVGFQTFNPESARKGLADARDYCDGR